MRTESQVQESFRNIVREHITMESLERAEALLDELRPESPLRHRLGRELEDIRKIHEPKGL